MTLTHVLWIGGGTSAGKTSIATALAAQHGLGSYHTDDHELEHARRRDPERHQAMEAWSTRTLDETWVEMPVKELVEETLAYSRERIELIIEDLQAASWGVAVVAEGFQLTPEVVAPLIESPRQAIWLLPTTRFRQNALLNRPQAWTMPNRTSDPKRAQAHRIERDGLLVERVREQALRHGLPTIHVDGTQTLEDVRLAVDQHFEPYLP